MKGLLLESAKVLANTAASAACSTYNPLKKIQAPVFELVAEPAGLYQIG